MLNSYFDTIVTSAYDLKNADYYSQIKSSYIKEVSKSIDRIKELTVLGKLQKELRPRSDFK